MQEHEIIDVNASGMSESRRVLVVIQVESGKRAQPTIREVEATVPVPLHLLEHLANGPAKMALFDLDQ